MTVDSFLSTLNTGDVASLYAPPEELTRSLRFTLDDPKNPVLVRLRSRYELERRLKPHGLDVERLVGLRTWIKSLWPHGQPLRLPPWNAEHIIRRGISGAEQFHCVHYSVAFLQCARSLGFEVRLVNLHRGVAADCPPGGEAEHDPPCDEHVVTEVWSRDLRQWVVFDVDYDCHYVERGQLLNAWDIHCRLVAGRAESIEMVPGPFTQQEMGRQSLAKRLSYYSHLSIFLRNDFLDDTWSPVRVAHPVDERTEPILWWFGEDMVPRPDLMGPIHVAKPYTTSTPVLNDGRLDTAWASADTPRDHWVEVRWPSPVLASEVVIHWADRGLSYRTSRRYVVEAELGHQWITLAEGRGDEERAWHHHQFQPVLISGLRVRQPPGGGHPDSPNVLWLRQIQVF